MTESNCRGILAGLRRSWRQTGDVRWQVESISFGSLQPIAAGKHRPGRSITLAIASHVGSTEPLNHLRPIDLRVFNMVNCTFAETVRSAHLSPLRT